ncbi:MAG: hypothetical protein WB402_11710 [Sulfuricaulis sp.]|uniref:hypothetical protein n=1 Tax=Sulfuricaulis sp. TaxID=2003553 RepID=UPI003C4407CB
MKYTLPIGLSAVLIAICTVYLYKAYALSDNEGVVFAITGVLYAVLWSVVLIVAVHVAFRLLGARPVISLLPSLYSISIDLCIAAIVIAVVNAITSKAILHFYVDDLWALFFVAAAVVIWRVAAITMAKAP